jgi:hypothetical protein
MQRSLGPRSAADQVNVIVQSLDPIALAAYLGKEGPVRGGDHRSSQTGTYADQNQQDYQAFTEVIRFGRLEAVERV